MSKNEITKISLPYGKSKIEVNIPKANLIGIAQCKQLPELKDELSAINYALDHPINSPYLEQIVRPGGKVCIVVDDTTRPTPTYKLLPPLLNRLNSFGVRKGDIKIIIATGMHRPATSEEFKLLLGSDIVNNYQVVSHDSSIKKEMVYVGRSKSGNPIWINQNVINCDFKILVGYIRPHPIFGYSGGRKSIVPGVANEQTNKYNHRPEWVCRNPYCDYLNLTNNPSHEDAVDIARRVNVDFILNVVLNKKKEIVKVVAGELVEAWLEAVEVVKQSVLFEVNELADVVISSPGNYPDDINLYQALPYAIVSRKQPVFKKGASMILIARCQDGLGSEQAFKILKEAKNFSEVISRLEKYGIKKDEHAAYAFAYFSLLHKINTMVFTKGVASSILKELKVEPVKSLQSSVEKAFQIHGNKARILVVPNSKNVVVKFKEVIQTIK